MPLDAVRREDHYEVNFDLPGVDPATIDVKVERKGLDGDRISANYHDGVLTVTIPVSEQAQARKIEITTGEATAEQAA
jgi:HSP20 family protein